jgi:hypothetical protein
MLVGREDVGSNQLKSMHIVILAFKSNEATEGVLYGIWRFVTSVQRKARCIQNGVVCVEVDQRITSSKSNIIGRKESARELNPVAPP